MNYVDHISINRYFTKFYSSRYTQLEKCIRK